MPNEEEIASQKKLLETYRRTLAHLCEQAAQYGGEVFVSPEIVNRLYAVRQEIRRIKPFLRASGVRVEDLPNEEPQTSAPPDPEHLPSDPPLLIDPTLEDPLANPDVSAEDTLEILFGQPDHIPPSDHRISVLRRYLYWPRGPVSPELAVLGEAAVQYLVRQSDNKCRKVLQECVRATTTHTDLRRLIIQLYPEAGRYAKGLAPQPDPIHELLDAVWRTPADAEWLAENLNYYLEATPQRVKDFLDLAISDTALYANLACAHLSRSAQQPPRWLQNLLGQPDQVVDLMNGLAAKHRGEAFALAGYLADQAHDNVKVATCALIILARIPAGNAAAASAEQAMRSLIDDTTAPNDVRQVAGYALEELLR